MDERQDQPIASQVAPFADDCRHYRGDRPCVHNRLCGDCPHYAPYGQRICVIKLGALGDVIRTLCILPELRRRHPNSHITWVTLANGVRLLTGHPQINRLVEFGPLEALALAQERFDVVICLDKEPQPCALAMSLRTSSRLGVGLGAHGKPVPLNRQTWHYFALGLSDELKFRGNDKSYPQLVYEALGWTYRGDGYELPLSPALRAEHQTRLTAMGWSGGKPTVGINVGAGAVFANKMWPAAKTVEVIEHLRRISPSAQVLLLGGPSERETIREILRTTTVNQVFDGGSEHAEPSFVALVDLCDVVFSGDTMAMHVAIARQKPVVVFFGPTCEQEIDLFGKGVKLVSSAPCAPCYKRSCDRGDLCLRDISSEETAKAIDALLPWRGERRLSLPVWGRRQAS
ncbi:MAG: glycosyltransferase family 9 protein [Phycisphaeraceae bacterium]|nr:glycosyltransferase family 9 protein [Phycisphaeraceae bacterium]